MSSAKKPVPTPLPSLESIDKDSRAIGGSGPLEPTDSETSKTNDYEDDPSTFRGKGGPKESQDDIDNDYEQDPSTFRGKQEVEFMDHESDPSTFRGKQEQGHPEAGDFVSNGDI